MINGVTMNKLLMVDQAIGGLIDATRNQEFSVGTAPSDYTFEASLVRKKSIPEHLSIDLSAPTLSGTNTNYTLRMMATYASGTSNSGVVRAISREALRRVFDGTTTMVIFFC
jgi:hypothetical protein